MLIVVNGQILKTFSSHLVTLFGTHTVVSPGQPDAKNH